MTSPVLLLIALTSLCPSIPTTGERVDVSTLGQVFEEYRLEHVFFVLPKKKVQERLQSLPACHTYQATSSRMLCQYESARLNGKLASSTVNTSVPNTNASEALQNNRVPRSLADTFMRTLPIIGNILLAQDTSTNTQHIHLLHEEVVRAEEMINNFQEEVVAAFGNINKALTSLETEMHENLLLRMQFTSVHDTLDGLYEARQGSLSTHLIPKEAIDRATTSIVAKIQRDHRCLLYNNTNGLLGANTVLNENTTHYHVTIDVPTGSCKPWTREILGVPLLNVNGRPGLLSTPHEMLHQGEKFHAMPTGSTLIEISSGLWATPLSVASLKADTCLKQLIMNQTAASSCDIRLLPPDEMHFHVTQHFVYIYLPKNGSVYTRCKDNQQRDVHDRFFFSGIKDWTRYAPCKYIVDQTRRWITATTYKKVEIPLTTIGSITPAPYLIHLERGRATDIPLADLISLRSNQFSSDSHWNTTRGRDLLDASDSIFSTGIFAGAADQNLWNWVLGISIATLITGIIACLFIRRLFCSPAQALEKAVYNLYLKKQKNEE